MAKNNVAKLPVKLQPLDLSGFGAMTHRVNSFSMEVPGDYKKADLENPDAWVHVARSLTGYGDEIRCIADDMSFVAYAICTYVQGSIARVKVIGFHKLDAVDTNLGDNASKFEAKLCGSKRWCVRHKETGEIVKQDIETQALAYKELEDYQKALRS